MSYIQNFAKEITVIEEELGEKINLATWSKFEGWRFGEVDQKYAPANELAGKLHTRDVTLAVMNYEHNTSYGSQECHELLAWTDNYVIYVEEYDGATGLTSKPRNPVQS